MKFIINIIVLLALSHVAIAEVYSWKDENGVTHFGDRKIANVKQKEVELAVQSSKWEKYKIEIIDVDKLLSDEERQKISIGVNSVYEFYDNYLYFDMYQTVPVKIRLYENQKDYVRYIEKHSSSTNNRHSRGIYLRKRNEIVVRLNKKERWRTFWTIKHEAGHAIIDTVTPFVPSWLNEGLSENMEVVAFNKDRLMLLAHKENYNSVKRAKKAGQNLYIDRFLHTSSKNFYKGLGGPSISGGHANAGELVRLLLSTSPGRDCIVELIHTYERGSRSYSGPLLDKCYFGGLPVLQNDWNRWVSRPKSIKIKL